MKNLRHLQGKSVEVELEHKIYGRQNVYIKEFQPIDDQDKIGFMYNNREIFMYRDEIISMSISKNLCKIDGKIQTIKIKTQVK